jgi:hypothetical protein
MLRDIEVFAFKRLSAMRNNTIRGNVRMPFLQKI